MKFSTVDVSCCDYCPFHTRDNDGCFLEASIVIDDTEIFDSGETVAPECPLEKAVYIIQKK